MPSMINEYALIAKVCRASYYDFLKEFWDTFVPEELILNWHIKLICDELQAVAERVFLNLPKKYDLIINISPGTSKSSAASIALLPWMWTRMPSCRSINASHAQDLVLELSRKTREIIYSEKYQKCFPEIQLIDDQNTKGHFVNSRGGSRFSCTVGGKSPIGMHAHIHVADDPIDPQQAISDASIDTANAFMTETLSTRKINKAACPLILIMQRLSQGDPSGYILQKNPGRVKHICLPAELTDDVRPEYLREFYVDGLMDPVRLPYSVLEEFKEHGDYLYCTPGITPILMSNWKEKKMEDVEIGDEVVGYALGGDGKRAKIVKAVVTDKTSKEAKVVKITMESGRELFCTENHKWWTSRLPHKKWGNRKPYMPARIGGNLMSVYEPLKKLTAREQRLFDWLGGMIDGDGGVSGTQVVITQSSIANPKIYKRILKVLDELGFSYCNSSSFSPGGQIKGRGIKGGEKNTITIGGGRYSKMRLVNHSYMVKKSRVLKAIWDRPSFVAEKKDKVVKIESAGKMEVFGLTTTSGNYVAWGYASQNSSQFLQNPIPLGGGMFKVDALQEVDGVEPEYWYFKKVVRYWDNAGSPGRSKRVDRRRAWTVGVKMGLHRDGSFWLLDVQRGRWSVHEREAKKLEMAKIDGKRVLIVQEQEGGSGGQESAEDTVRRLAGYTIKLDLPRGEKELRAAPYASQVNIGNVKYLKAPWNKEYLEEMKHYPHSTYKDQVDASSGAFNAVHRLRRKIGAY